MYNEKIEQLIKAALADGVLTEKEKQVLFKKAHELGIDLDEFEMVLDAKLYEAQEAEKQRRAKAAPKSDKYADVKKCPACGTIIPPNTKVCPGCGMVFSNEQNDIKEIAQLQDNYVKISSEPAKFPHGYFYVAGLILVTLLNVFAWVYAIACDDLVGLPVLSTIVWIVAIIVFFKIDKTFRVFSKKYDTAVAEHSKLLSTAKAFYAQDKDTLNRINNIATEVDQIIAEKNKTKRTLNLISLGVLSLSIILSFTLSFGWFNRVIVCNSGKRCLAAINESVKANQMDKAESYFTNYTGWDSGYKRKFAKKIMCAYIEQDNEEKVLSFYKECNNYSSSENTESVVNYFSSKDQHQAVIDFMSQYGYSRVYYTLKLCIRDLMRKGKKADALKLIKTNSYLFNDAKSDSEYYKPKVVKELTNLTRE